MPNKPLTAISTKDLIRSKQIIQLVNFLLFCTFCLFISVDLNGNYPEFRFHWMLGLMLLTFVFFNSIRVYRIKNELSNRDNL